MSFDADKLNYCKQLVERKLGWGDSASWQNHDFQKLRELIFEETNVDLSESTLRRVWGKVKYEHLPSHTTLNTLARFAGFEDWRALEKPTTSFIGDNYTGSISNEMASRKPRNKSVTMLVVIAAFAVTAFVVVISFKRSRVVVQLDYSFTSRPVTRSIPNSVVFEYNAAGAPTDSVFIQQSWDDRRRALVSKSGNKYTSIYYEPGFYKAKLLVGGKVVKEHPLLIPSNGWLALIDQSPVPVYLDSADFISKQGLRVPLSLIEKNNLRLQPDPPVLKFFNVGNFKPVSVLDFVFEAEIKNEYREGAAACQMSELALITDDLPITIPLSDSGCISELNLVSPGNMVSGKNVDLSGFGVDFSDWVKITCRSTGKTIEYLVNDKLAYVSTLPAEKINIVGIGCFFKGTGAIRRITLRRNDEAVFRSFF